MSIEAKVIEVHARPQGCKFRVTVLWPSMGPVKYIITGEQLDEYCGDPAFAVYESMLRETWPHQLPLPETD